MTLGPSGKGFGQPAMACAHARITGVSPICQASHSKVSFQPMCGIRSPHLVAESRSTQISGVSMTCVSVSMMGVTSYPPLVS